LLKVMTKKLFFLKVKKSGGSKETDELKRKLESKSLLELLDIMDDSGKWKLVETLKSVDPKQSVGINHLGLDGYLRKAISLLENGQQLVGGGLSANDRRELEELREKKRTGTLTKKEERDLEDLEVEAGDIGVVTEEAKEYETEAEQISKEIEAEYATLDATMAGKIGEAKLLALIGGMTKLENPIRVGEPVDSIGSLKEVIDYRNAEYGKKRNLLQEKALASAEYSSHLLSTNASKDYDQFVENEAVRPLAEIISQLSGKPISPEKIENAPNVLKYFGLNKENRRFNKKTGNYEMQPHVTDELDYDVIEHNGKYFVAEVKGRSFGKQYAVDDNKLRAFKNIKREILEKDRSIKPENIISILMWPNASSAVKKTPSGKYYKHIPSYGYVVNPHDKTVAERFELKTQPGRYSGPEKFVYKFKPEEVTKIDNPKLISKMTTQRKKEEAEIVARRQQEEEAKKEADRKKQEAAAKKEADRKKQEAAAKKEEAKLKKQQEEADAATRLKKQREDDLKKAEQLRVAQEKKAAYLTSRPVEEPNPVVKYDDMIPPRDFMGNRKSETAIVLDAMQKVFGSKMTKQSAAIANFKVKFNPEKTSSESVDENINKMLGSDYKNWEKYVDPKVKNRVDELRKKREEEEERQQVKKSSAMDWIRSKFGILN
jgi:hypothetical protein